MAKYTSREFIEFVKKELYSYDFNQIIEAYKRINPNVEVSYDNGYFIIGNDPKPGEIWETNNGYVVLIAGKPENIFVIFNDFSELEIDKVDLFRKISNNRSDFYKYIKANFEKRK